MLCPKKELVEIVRHISHKSNKSQWIRFAYKSKELVFPFSSDPEPFIIFSGGMPRASYGDKHTVSVMQGSNHTVFDFTSRVIDFIAITRGDEDDTEESRAGKKK